VHSSTRIATVVVGVSGNSRRDGFDIVSTRLTSLSLDLPYLNTFLDLRDSPLQWHTDIRRSGGEVGNK
jgi:hypothetical protein